MKKPSNESSFHFLSNDVNGCMAIQAIEMVEMASRKKFTPQKSGQQ